MYDYFHDMNNFVDTKTTAELLAFSSHHTGKNDIEKNTYQPASRLLSAHSGLV